MQERRSEIMQETFSNKKSREIGDRRRQHLLSHVLMMYCEGRSTAAIPCTVVFIVPPLLH
jgi:hypothetical protein